MLNTVEVQILLSRAVRNPKLVLGVYPSDNIPNFKTEEFAIVCNVDTKYQKGSHWCAFYKTEGSLLEFFDSFGLHPALYCVGFANFIKQQGSYFRRNIHQIQDFDSTCCGNYCVYFLGLRSRKIPMQTIINSFDNVNFRENDAFVLSVTEPQWRSTSCKTTTENNEECTCVQYNQKCSQVTRLLRSYCRHNVYKKCKESKI